MSRLRSIVELGDLVNGNAHSLRDLLNAANIPQPSLALGAPKQPLVYSKDIEECRASLLGALDELRALVLGPRSYIFNTAIIAPSCLATFHSLYKFRIAQHVPLDSEISYEKLGERCGLLEADLRRIVRSAVSLRIFEEDTMGFVRHNASSAVLSTMLGQDALGFATDEYGRAATRYAESVERFPGSDRAGESPCAIANGTISDKDAFALIANDAPRVSRLANAMSFMTTVPETSIYHLLDNVPWSPSRTPSQRCPGVVVDVGGSRGTLMEALLRKYPGIAKGIVEDLPEVTESNVAKPHPGDLASRLEYQEYDFFTEQVIKDADVYVFRTIFHDWPDTYAVQILKNQIPALKSGATILINDICMQPGVEKSRLANLGKCAYDLMVKMGLNAKERTEEEWKSLLAGADKRFKIQSIVSPPCAIHSVIEVTWQG
ncbi:putative S-adenosyl-L-methionine-dependent methyltransferase [Rosellinia necatrix]|uniref:Putative S-adenosyl-L-methionine-dependent methyltransferase n=1 Tax=Rosellinia necatrix TaxID=77044 RepID=A0A1S7UQ46_ROSNE|nr:putative S-adenosyl-L-methionine-dependent methyltransferase [Rosellinia necatrix]